MAEGYSSDRDSFSCAFFGVSCWGCPIEFLFGGELKSLSCFILFDINNFLLYPTFQYCWVIFILVYEIRKKNTTPKIRRFEKNRIIVPLILNVKLIQQFFEILGVLFLLLTQKFQKKGH